MGIVKSPLRHRNTLTDHDTLSEADHNKFHGGEKANFKTIEEENDFRNFINKSNPDYAKDFKVDIENTTGKLNNRTIRKAYEEYGGLYQDYKGKIHVFEQKEIKAKETFEKIPNLAPWASDLKTPTTKQRTQRKPLGVDYRGNVLYDLDRYEFTENMGEYFNNGDLSESEFRDRLKRLMQRSRYSNQDFDWQNIYAKETGGIFNSQITLVNKLSGSELIVDLKKDYFRSDDVSDFINGYDVITSVGDEKKMQELAEKQPNPLLEFNTKYNGRLITNLEDYNQVLFPEYEKSVVKIPVKNKVTKKNKEATEHKNNPVIAKESENNVELDYTKVEQIDGVWYALHKINGQMVEIDNSNIKSELNWSNAFKPLSKFNENHGIYDLFFGGHDNYIDAQISMDNFFNLDEEDAAGLLNDRLSKIGYEVVVTGGFDGMGQYSTQYITVRETFSADKKEIIINLPWDITGLTEGGKRNIARKEFIKLHNFLSPHLKKLSHTKNGSDNNYEEHEELLENITLTEPEKNKIALEAGLINYEDSFVDPSGEYHYHYKRAADVLAFNGVSTEDVLYEAKIKDMSLDYLIDENENTARELKSKDYHNEIEGTNKEYKVKNVLLSKKESLNKKISKFNLDYNSKLDALANHSDWEVYNAFMKVYQGNGQFEFEKVDLTTETIEGTYTGTYRTGGFGPHTDIRTSKDGENLVGDAGFWKYEQDFEQDYSQEVSYYDEVEVELENGTKVMCPRGFYNDFIVASNNLFQMKDDIDAFEIETLTGLDELKLELGDVEGLIQVANLNYDDWEKTYTKLGLGFADLFMNICYGSHTMGRNLMGMDAIKDVSTGFLAFQDESNRITNSFQKTWRELDPTIESNLNPFSAGFWSEANREWAWNGFIEQVPILAAYMGNPWMSYPRVFLMGYGDAQLQMEREFRETGKERGFWEKTAIATTYSASEVVLGALPTRYITPRWMGGAKNGLSNLLWTKFVPKKWKLLSNKAVETTIRKNPKFNGMLNNSISQHIIATSPNLFVARYGEYYTEGWAQMIQNAVMGRPVMEHVKEAQDLGFLIGGGMADVSFAHGTVLNYYSDVNSWEAYNDNLAEKNDLLQKTSNLKLKIDLILQGAHDGDIDLQLDIMAKAEQDIETNVKLITDLDTEMRNIIEAQEKKVLKIGNKFFTLYQQNFEAMQNIRLEAESIANNKTIGEDTKNKRLEKLKVKFDAHQDVRNMLKNDEVFGDHWKAFEASQVEEDVERRGEIMGKVTTELMEGGNANPTDQQINEAAQEEYYFQEINNDHNKRRRTKLARDFNNFQEADDAIKAYDKLLKDGEIDEGEYNKLVEGAKDGTDLGATITLKNGDTYAYQIVRNAAKAGRAKTRVHEQGHQMVIEAFGENSQVEALVAQQLLNFVQHKDADLYALLTMRIEKNEEGQMKMNEVIPNFLELVSEGKIDFDSKKNRGLGSLIGNLFGWGVSDATGTNFSFDFEGEEDAVNFIIGLGKKLSDKSLTMKDRAQMKKNALSKIALVKDVKKALKKGQKIKKSTVNLDEGTGDISQKIDRYTDNATTEEDLFKKNPDTGVIPFNNIYNGIIQGKFDRIFGANISQEQKVIQRKKLADRFAGMTEEGGYDPAKTPLLSKWMYGGSGKAGHIIYSGLAAKLDLFKKGEKAKREVRGDEVTETGKTVFEGMVDPSTTQDKTSEKRGPKQRVLTSLSDIDLINNEFIDDKVMKTISDVIDKNPPDLEQQLTNIIEKEFNKVIIEGMGGNIKGNQKDGPIIQEDYEVFVNTQYKNVIESLSDDVIKKNYNKLFDLKKIGKEKKITRKKDKPELKKDSYFEKDIFAKKVNKVKWIKHFTQGGYTTLRARQTALAKLIAEAKSKDVIDNYLNTDISGATRATLEKVSKKLDRQKNQIRSFDSIQYAKKQDVTVSQLVEGKNFGTEIIKKAYNFKLGTLSEDFNIPLCPLVNGRRDLNAPFPNGKGTYDEVFTRALNDFVKMFPEFRDIFRSTLTGGKRAGWYTSVDNFDVNIPETGTPQKNKSKKSYSETGTKFLKPGFVKLFSDPDFLMDQNERLPLLKDLFKAIETYLNTGNNKQNVWIFEEILKDTSKHMSTFTRILAPVGFVPKINGKYVFDQEIVEEHTDPQNQVGKGLLWAAYHGEVDIMWKTIGQSYMQGAILKKHDPEGNLKSAMPEEYYQFTVPLLKAGLLDLDPGMASVIRLAKSGPENNSNIVDLNIYYLDPMGINKSITEYFGVDTDREITPEIIKIQNETIVKVLTGKIAQDQATNELNSRLKLNDMIDSKKAESKIKNSKAMNMARAININTPSRGMSAWDFDDTLATTKSGVRAIIPNEDGTPQPGRKVIFLAGGAGSGKSNVVKKLGLEEQGFKIVNSDISLEWLKKNSGLPENMNDLTREQLSELGRLQAQSRKISKGKMMKYQGNADGVVVDGTGGSIKAMEKLVKEFKDKGYDVSMVFVETSLETALERNANRKERSLLDKIVVKNHEAVQGNKDGFKEMFGERFMEVKTDNLTQQDAMPESLTSKMNDFVSGYKKIRLDAEEFATQGAEILEQGGEFDFSEFNVVTEGAQGPMFKTAMDRAKKFGTKDTYVLTARPPAAAEPIQQFLASQGLNIPLENITGLGNSTGEAKAEWMLGKFSEGYNNMFFADDAMQNVEAVKDVLDQLDVKSEVVQAKIQFSKKMESTMDEILTDPKMFKSKQQASLNDVKNVNRLTNDGVYSNIRFSKKHRGEYENLISKNRPDLVKEGLVSQTVDQMFNLVNGLDIPVSKRRKYEKIMTKWLATSVMKLPEDNYKLKDSVELAEKNNEDIFSYNNPNEIIEKYAGKSKAKPTNPNNVKEFGESRVLNEEYGLTVHEVEDTKEGMASVREVVDTHWGPESNPWCIIARSEKQITEPRQYGYELAKTKQEAEARKKQLESEGFIVEIRDRGQNIKSKKEFQYDLSIKEMSEGPGIMDDAWQNWTIYDKSKKYVVFQNGRLLSFYANDQYWDRMDNPTDAPVISKKKGNVTEKVELVPISKGKVDEFVRERRTVSEDKNTVKTEYFVTKNMGEDTIVAGDYKIENRVNGQTVKETEYRPNGTKYNESNFKNGKKVSYKSFYPNGNLLSINSYGQPFGEMSKDEVVKTKGDIIESMGTAYNVREAYHAEVLFKGKVAEVGMEIGKDVKIDDLLKTSPNGEIRLDLNKVLEADINARFMIPGVSPTTLAGALSSNVQFSKEMDVDLNQILEESMNVGAEKRFSAAQAKIRGQKFKIRGLVPASAQDFMGLMYNFVGKGEQGDKHLGMLKKALVDPFARGIDELNTSRQNSAEDYRALLKQFPEVKKELNNKLDDYTGFEGNNFTVDQAVRVYLWDKAGFEVPGLSARDLKALKNFVSKDSELVAFADALSVVSKKSEGYSKPGEYWLTENISSDLMSDGAVGDARSEFLAEWIENKNIIFSEENSNKIEAIYGSKFREALEDILYAMETGNNRPKGGGRLLNEYMNWVNGSVGAIMFFNVRSAVLQTISATNYINLSDNNPLKAAAAFANQKQFWSDFIMLFNSNYLKQRRAGNRRGINEAELSRVVVGVDPVNQAKAVIRYLLKIGFLPTQIADSFAIASGGASFYRNRVNTYIKQGMSKADAESQAFLDFQETTEVSQQSARPDMISQQQRNPLGRIILAFANTPMQYGRIMNKAFRDIANGRGDTKTHISKIIYYGAVQAVIFTALQNALFAVIGTEDDDEKEEMMDKKTERMLNSMIDTWLTTFGYGGKAISTVKNTIVEYNKQRSRDVDDKFLTRSDHAYTLLQALSFSPPISSKLRKIYQSIQTEKFNRDLLKDRGFKLDNPVWSMIGNVVEATTYIPLGRLSKKLLNLDNAMDSRNETWKRIALILGWSTWDLGIKDPDLETLKLEVKEQKKQEKEIEKQEKKEEKLKKKYPNKTPEEIEVIVKSKELFSLSKQTQVDVLEALDLEPNDYPKEKDRCDKIAELYKDNNKLIEETIEKSKNKPKKEKKKKEKVVLSKKEKRSKDLFKMKKQDQINKLLELGYSPRKINSLKYEKDRVEMIMKLEGKKSK